MAGNDSNKPEEEAAEESGLMASAWNLGSSLWGMASSTVSRCAPATAAN